MPLKGKVALVIGGGKTGDAECARQLARDRANLALHCHHPESQARIAGSRDEMVKTHPGIRISIHGGDLGSATAIDKLLNEVVDQHKKIDMVVNTVGMVLNRPIANLPEAENSKMFAYQIFVDEQRRRCVTQLRAESLRQQHLSS